MYSFIISVITFARAGIYLNPSRVAPSTVRQGGSYALLANTTGNYDYAVFTSVLIATACNFYSSEGTFRQIQGLLCTLEFERMGAFFCAVFQETELYAQIYEDSVAFTTRPKAKASASGMYIYIIFLDSRF